MNAAALIALCVTLSGPSVPKLDDVPEVEEPETPTPESSTPASIPESGTRVGVLPLVIAGGVSPEIGDSRERLSAEVHETLTDARYDTVLLAADDAGSADTPYCGDAVCWQRFAREHDVTHFLVMVVRFEDPDYIIDARLVDGRNGTDAGSQSKTCDLCGLTEVRRQVRDVASAMRREVEATLVLPPSLFVGSSPRGASVYLDNERVGLTPVELQPVAGAHRIRIEHPDYVSEKVDVDLVDGVRREVNISLRRRPRPVGPIDDGPPTEGATTMLALGASAIGIGVGAIAGGAALILIHGDPIERDCVGSNVDALGRCRFLHDTRAGGFALTGIGAALVGGGVVVTVLGARRRKAARVKAGVSANGITLSGRF